MQQSAKDVLVDLRRFVAGRGRDDNFCYSKVYSPSSYIRCVDFSPWVGRRLMMNDMFALGVFKAQLNKDSSFSVSLEISVSDDGNVEMEERDDIVIPFSKEIKRNKEDIVKIVQFPFDKYFMGEFKTAKLDIVISWILGFSREQFARILTAYDLSLNNAQMYLDRHNKEKNTKLELPSSLPKTAKVEEFRKEFRKLPLSSRLHLFDILSYSGFKTKKPKLRLISDMTLYDTRKLGIDEHESANILSNNKLVVSLQDGTGYIDPAYIDVISMATEYAKGMDPVYRQWESDIFDKLSGPDVIIFDDTDDLFEDEND